MLVLDSPAAINTWAVEQRLHRRTIALVPTMGALHAGHLALISEAHRRADLVVVSIFVNPLQFNRPDDFARYPRPMESDIDLCRQHGVAAVYAPTQSSMYPPLFDTHIEPSRLADSYEGAGRPGHFRGVATVVAKLFNAVGANVAVFGEKDYQQLAVIRRMACDLDMGVDVIGVQTVRHDDGLAMSSRNALLLPSQRRAAVVVSAALNAARRAFAEGTAQSPDLIRTATATVAGEPLARLEYVDIVHSETLIPSAEATHNSRMLIAVWFDQVRLIDNIALG